MIKSHKAGLPGQRLRVPVEGHAAKSHYFSCWVQPGAPYAVTLLFCELYFTGPDARRFTVTYNGQQALLFNFSVFQAAGMLCSSSLL